jgi:hypothetical protein
VLDAKQFSLRRGAAIETPVINKKARLSGNSLQLTAICVGLSRQFIYCDANIKLVNAVIFRAYRRERLVAYSLRFFDPIMNNECQHCGKLNSGRTYRVVSQDGGTTLLDLTVCYNCFLEARRLGLHAEEVRPRELSGGYHAHA